MWEAAGTGNSPAKQAAKTERQDYKSLGLRAAVVICATLVNTHTCRQADRQLLTPLTYTLSSAS